MLSFYDPMTATKVVVVAEVQICLTFNTFSQEVTNDAQGTLNSVTWAQFPSAQTVIQNRFPKWTDCDPDT